MSTIKQSERIVALLKELVKGAGQGLFGNAIYFGITFPSTNLAKANDVFINTNTLVFYQLVTSRLGSQWIEKTTLKSGLQPLDNISELTNDVGYLSSETDPIFLASEAANFVAGDKTNLDNQSGVNTGDETTLSIQTKRPLKTIESQSLEGVGNIDITKNDVGLLNVDNTSDLNKPVSTAQQIALNLKYDASNPNNYIDSTGAPVQPSDLADFETTTELNARDTANRNRANHTGTQLASTISDFETAVANNTAVAENTEKRSYAEIDEFKLSTIEAYAEINNITDFEVGELTGGGDTTLHNHNSSYIPKGAIKAGMDNSSSKTVTFSTPFPSGANVVVVANAFLNDNFTRAVVILTISNTGFTYRVGLANDSASGAPIMWQAIDTNQI